MKALTIREPYVERILAGLKPEEYRTQRWAYRGPVLLHSGLAFYDAPWEDWDGLGEEAALAGRAALNGRIPAAKDHWPHPLGHVRGIARITHYRVAGTSRGKTVYGACLADVLRLEHPFPVRGQQGLFDVDLDRHGTLDACREIAAWLTGGPAPFGPQAQGGAR